MKKLLIIGGSGFIGSSIIDYGINKKLIKYKINKIYILSRSIQTKINKKRYISINYIHNNILNVDELPQVDYVIYCLKSNKTQISNIYFNKFIELVKKFKTKPNILFISSGAVYGKLKNKKKCTENKKIDPNTINNFNGYKKKYALEKVFIENKFIELGNLNFKVSIARCFNFIGRHSLGDGQLIGKMIYEGLNKKIITVNNSSKVYRAYLNTNDLVNWLVTILKNSSKSCPIYNVGSDKSISMKSLGKKIAKIFNKKIKFKEKKKLDIDYYVPSINKAKKLLKLKISINLNDSLNSFIK